MSSLTKTRAFTLLELLIVLLIIGILIAIGLYRYQSVVEAGYDKDAQTALRASYINAETIRTQSSNSETFGNSLSGLTTSMQDKAEADLNYIEWSTSNGLPDYNDAEDLTPVKDVLVSWEENGEQIVLCNKSKGSDGYFCLKTNVTEGLEFTANDSQTLPQFAANSGDANAFSFGKTLPAAYCVLPNPGGNTPPPCSGVDITEATVGWGGGATPNEENEGPGEEPEDPAALPTPPNAYITTDLSDEFWLVSGTQKAKLDGYNTVMTGTSPGLPKFSPDYSKIMHKANNESFSADYYVANRDGTNPVDIDTLIPGGFVPFASFVDNDTVVATGFNSSQEVYMVDLDGNNLVNISDGQAGHDQAPVYNATTNKVVWYNNNAGNFRLYIANADGSGSPTHLINAGLSVLMPVFSPDGQYIYYTNLVGGKNIWRINADGTNPINLTAASAYRVNSLDNRVYSVSPDGSKIVYVTNGNPWRYFVVPTDGSSAPVEVAQTNNLYYPSWSADGSLIVSTCNKVIESVNTLQACSVPSNSSSVTDWAIINQTPSGTHFGQTTGYGFLPGT